ncbi:GNAT family N-acetyltransferase [Bacillus songklensis]|uniref:GNAT family N-acetyltransferase n=1 Tax=Bacillus songklensis TaxID=1069116 RepID=A0ABV8B4J0_9BACI
MNVKVMETLTEDDVKNLYDLYQQEWWTKGRKLNDIKEMLKHTSLVIGIQDAEANELIGFGRVLTDYVYKALVLDIIVKGSHRKKGIGQYLMNYILQHHSLQHVRHFELYCRPEMEGFYELFGFSKDTGGVYFMRRSREKGF